MRNSKTLSILASLALTISLAPMASAAHHRSLVSPHAKIGPRAIPAHVAGPAYKLFGCQIVGLSPDGSCYDPYQMRHAYNIDTLISAGFDGKGKTIVIVDAFQSPNIKNALNQFDTFYGIPGLNGLGNAAKPGLGKFTQVAPDGLTPFDPSNDDMFGWAAEISLDVVWAHAIAPGANIVLVLAKSDDDADILSATKYAVRHNLGDIISQSFGENESCVDPDLLAEQHLVFVEATLKNMTIFASSGDDGATQATCDGSSFVKAVSSPAVDPLVTAVGGTELHAAQYCLTSLGCDPTTNPLPGTYEGEIVWNEDALGYGATGGGFSVLFGEPFYQKGTIHGGKHAGVPDVSYNAAVNYGVLTYLDIPGLEPGFYVFGGTSAGSPQWAAILSIADEKAGYDLGFVNKALYHIGQAPPHYSASFFDIKSGNNSVAGVTGYSAGPGWDPTTGLGSPKTEDLVSNLLKFVSPGDGLWAILESAFQGPIGLGKHGRMRPHVMASH